MVSRRLRATVGLGSICCSFQLSALLKDLEADACVDYQSADNAEPDRGVVRVDSKWSPIIIDPAPKLRILVEIYSEGKMKNIP